MLHQNVFHTIADNTKNVQQKVRKFRKQPLNTNVITSIVVVTFTLDHHLQQSQWESLT